MVAAQWLAVSPHSKKILYLNLAASWINLLILTVVLAISGPVWVFSGYLAFPPQSKGMHARLICDSKLAVSISASANVCLCLC